jgi:hypothetical protein
MFRTNKQKSLSQRYKENVLVVGIFVAPVDVQEGTDVGAVVGVHDVGSDEVHRGRVPLVRSSKLGLI